MQAPDSYHSLAESIERTLRRELTPRDSAAELTAEIDHVLLAQECAGELRLSYVRTIVVAGSIAVGLWAAARTGPALSPLVLGGLALLSAWGGTAAGQALALRRGWYRPWLRYASPALDASMIWGSFLLLWYRGAGTGATVPAVAIAHTTALCAFLAMAGALRLSRASAELCTALAIGIFLFAAAAAGLPVVPAGAAVATLLAVGALSMSVTTLVRRTVTAQVSRLELARMYEEARHAVDAREEVLKIVSHDLRNPLNTISMSAGLMLELEVAEAQRVKYLTTIKRAAERMNRLIQDLLDVAKLEAGRLAVAAKPTDVAALLAEADEMLRPLVAERSLRLLTAAADQLPTIVADQGRVLQVLSNLVGNAIKFTPPGGRITMRAEPVGGGVCFTVSDTGAGIPPDQLSRIFGRFWQGDRTDRRGIGLGLAITKGIVEAHGGRIWVESRLGEGTTFRFTLAEEPAQPAETRSGAERRRGSLESPATT